MTPIPPFAHVGGLLATDLEQVADLQADPSVLDRGWWMVVGTFEGELTGYRFGRVRPAELPAPVGRWPAPAPEQWRSSLDRDTYLDGVRRIRAFIQAGDVYQVNLCRLLQAPLAADADPLVLAHRLAAGNPAPWSGVLHLGSSWIVSASPELFLARDGDRLASSPIKGTTHPGEPFADKDFPENIMITDLVRNDLGRLARPGSVVVTELLARQEHPGLAHLVSTVTARLADGVGWAQILPATFPPGSVTGAPKIRALEVIAELEPVPRQVYCGAFGFVDGDRRRARLAVAIRTFFATPGPAGAAGRDRAPAAATLHFGTGAGITWASDPAAEWAETELKAARLIALTGTEPTSADPGRSTPAPDPAATRSAAPG